jgi:septal ring factor EnvC (AmiA/AmiB activator)
MTRKIAIILSCISALCVGQAIAQTAKPESELQEIERKLKQRAAEEARLKDEAKAREKEVSALRNRMIETANALQAAEARIREIGAEIGRLETEASILEGSLKAERETLSNVLAALLSIERSKPPALLVNPEDAAGAARTAMLLADVAPQLEARAATLKESLTKLNTVRESLNREKAEFERTNEEVSTRRSMLAELLEQKQQESRVAQRMAVAAQGETAALAARATTLRDVLGRLERLARAVTPRLKPPKAAPDSAVPATRPLVVARPDPVHPAQPFTSFRGKLKPPVVGNVIGRFGGPRQEGGNFDGLRFSVADKAIVTAPFEGKISFARAWSTVGNLIVLDVGGGYHILLLGVGAFLVEEGQSVRAGEPLAAMAGEGAELDLEIRKDGEPVNPSLWLSDKARDDAAS